MGLFGKGNTMNMIHIEGLPGYTKGTAITFTLDEGAKCLVFKARAFKKPEVKLPLSKVTFAGIVPFEEIEKGSVIGRAVIGGILFGSAGAIIGAMTAEEKKRKKYFYVINYDEQAIILDDNGSNFNSFKFQKKLNEYLPKKQPETEITL